MDSVLKTYYTGSKLLEKSKLPDGTILRPYLPDEKLKEAVNLAIALGKPLLIKGEPGCGKTKLAAAIAQELFYEELHDKENPICLKDIYFEWHVKSTSKAKDGLYRYDYIERLQDAQLEKAGVKGKIKPEFDYVKKGPVGLAFDKSHEVKKHVVVLIDEIDKADTDFPNDLLRELDEMSYTIEEIEDAAKKEQKANFGNKPIIIITSNDERELPLPFLRRCLFFHIDFPKEENLINIVAAHFRDKGKHQVIIEKVVNDFYRVRKQMENEKDEREKKISTSELIDWCEILLMHKDEDIKQLLGGQLPYSTILFKNREDIHRFNNAHLD